MENTSEQFQEAIRRCKKVYENKLSDYGASWRILRPTSVTDQIFIKAARIRSLEKKGKARIDEGIETEFIGIVNYGVIGLIQLEAGKNTPLDLHHEEAIARYDQHIEAVTNLMWAKNHDYDEAWRHMRVSTYTDIILMKLCRIKQIEDNGGQTLYSEGIDANYADIINYALFALIQLER
ncbi:MAG: DUF1599 domain-containing protein [Tannerellaceae bacterium]|jgi:hypothetical protein|nr:DUF1599 domain-containing protein [Tannerellaceae bacterium]